MTWKLVSCCSSPDGFVYLLSMKKGKRRFFVIMVLLLTLEPAWSQFNLPSNIGGSIGLVAAFGNRFDRMGICLRGYYVHGSVQLNGDVRFYGNIKNLGPPGFYPEGYAALGIVYGYGRRDSINSPLFLSSVSNQTGWSKSVGYSQDIYFNEIGTTQRTGNVSLQFGKFDLITENDIFARPLFDRYRTGAILLQYTVSPTTQLALNCTMWTGLIDHRSYNPAYPYPNGYMDTASSHFWEYSHGLLSFQAKTIFPGTSQQAQANIGVDAEQVRNAVQNRVIHDLIFLPAKWRSKRNADMPMIDQNGNQYLFLPGQKIRKPAPYFNAFLNPLIFY
jgi:hypothetical protein